MNAQEAIQLSYNDDNRLKWERFWVLTLAAIQFTHILDFVILMPLGPGLMKIFQISPSKFGILVSSYSFSAGIVNFFASLYGDNFERKKMLMLCFVGFLIGTFLCSQANSFEIL